MHLIEVGFKNFIGLQNVAFKGYFQELVFKCFPIRHPQFAFRSIDIKNNSKPKISIIKIFVKKYI